MTTNVRKYLGVESNIGDLSVANVYDPFSGDQEQQDIMSGPTPENPYRYTEHSTNKQGSLIAGRETPGVSGRSQFDGVYNPGGIRNDVFWQEMLPMQKATVATDADLSSYEGRVNDPYSLMGRQEIARLGDYKGDTDRVSVFDMEEIGKSMGMNESQINSYLNPTYETVYAPKVEHTNKNDVVTTSVGGPWRTEEEILADNPDFDFNSDNYFTNQRIQGNTELPEGMKQDELDVFLGLSMMSNDLEGGGLNLDLNKNEHLDYLRKLGAGYRTQENYVAEATPFSGPYQRISSQTDFDKQQQTLYKGIDRSDDKPDPWKKALHGALNMITVAGAGVMLGTALGPAAVGALTPLYGGMATGAAVGGVTSIMTQKMQGMKDIDWKQAALGAGAGAAMGGVAGYYSGGTGAVHDPSGLGPQGMFAGYEQSLTGSLSVGTTAKGIAASGLGGGISGHQQTQAEIAAINHANKQLSSANSEKIASIQSAKKEFNNLFGLNDDPYINTNINTESIQEGIV